MRWCGVVCSFGVEAIGVFNSARESLMGEDVVCEGGDAKRPSQWQSGVQPGPLPSWAQTHT